MQENWPVAGSSDSMLSINPGCAWMRGKNSLFREVLNSFTLAGSIVQLTMREYMVASLKCCQAGRLETKSGTTLAPTAVDGQEQPGVSCHTPRSEHVLEAPNISKNARRWSTRVDITAATIPYALRRARRVKSGTCARILDTSMPSTGETNAGNSPI